MGGKSGSLALILHDLPPGISRKDLRAFVCNALREAGIRTLPLVGRCSNCGIMRIVDLAAGTTEYHGLIEVRPMCIAMQAIQILNGKSLHGHPLQVRRYRHRSPWGEHRARQQAAGGSGTIVARALVERRREHLRIDLVEATPSLPALVYADTDLTAVT